MSAKAIQSHLAQLRMTHRQKVRATRGLKNYGCRSLSQNAGTLQRGFSVNCENGWRWR